MHPRISKIYQDLNTMFWWPRIKSNIVAFVNKCLICQKVKIEHQRPSRALQPLEIPKWTWESISIDFVMGLPRTLAGYDAIWVIADKLTKFAQFANCPLEKLAHLYI